jgi:hypothetical protein
MSIKTFIQKKILAPRLEKKQVLVVYDPIHQYRSVCKEMQKDKRVVIDTSESSITSREEAMDAFLKVGRNEIDQLLIYIPKAKPIEEEEKQKDPFSLYSVAGTAFPEGDGDSFLSICLKAKPDFAPQIRAVFEENSNPSFSVIDAIGGGMGWPILQSILRVESTRDILFSFLCPTDQQKEALSNDDTWVSELRQLLKTSIGLTLITKGKTRSTISDELWRYILFSEFVFDLPETLPSELEDVPHGGDNAKALIEDICERLRNDKRVQSVYIQSAETIESDLKLVELCGHMMDLGNRDTFPFEERTFLNQAIKVLLSNDIDKVKDILLRHSDSVWTGKGEIQVQWDLLRSAISLIECCQDNDRLLNHKTQSLEGLIDYYVAQLREVDQYHREFEQSVSDYEYQDPQGLMAPVSETVRKQYGKLTEKVQFVFTKHFQQSGWPLTGRMSNNEVFDKLISPKLELSGNRVVFIMIDALRYELGVALEKQLSEDTNVEITLALAQLPTITSVGMSSLLPGASNSLRLVGSDSGILPFIGDQSTGTVSQRMEVIRKKFGNRFQEGRLDEYVRNKLEIDKDTDLLVLRSVEIDSQFENHPDTAPSEIMNILKRIRVAVYKLKEAGFHEAVIATDHGFILSAQSGPGDKCEKLSGDWINIHNRSLIGGGPCNDQHFCIDTENAGIKSEFKKYAGPLSLASYKSGTRYNHGGCSLQECVVPVIQMQLSSTKEKDTGDVIIKLYYKDGAKHITTRLPVLTVEIESKSPILTFEKDYEILLEAQDKKGNVVGEAKHGSVVNPATGTISLRAGASVQVTIKMSLEFEGKFKIKALNPTTMTIYDQLSLETDYTV